MARIGFVAALFNRGLSEVSRTLADALADLGHEIYWFVRQGMVYGQPMRETTGRWQVPNRTDWPAIEIQSPALQSWASYYGLKAVVFNEESDFTLPMVLQQAGVKTIQYMDAYLSREQRPYYRFLDQLWCVTGRAEAILQEWKQGHKTHHIGWGVRPEGFADETTLCEPRRFDFVHVAGWLGLDCRKGTDLLMAALDLMTDDPPEVLIHAQIPMEMALQIMGRETLPPHIVWETQDVPPPGLYHLGRVCVQVSKIEGFGLSFPEGLSAGRPMIAPASTPMSEFIDETCGWLVPISEVKPHVDGSVFQQTLVSHTSLAKIMNEARYASNTFIQEKSFAALQKAKALFDWYLFQGRLEEGLNRLGVSV